MNKIFIPTNNAVICKKTNVIKNSSSLFLLDKEQELPIYEIISISESLINKIDFKIGDKVICNSTGTKLKLNNGSELFLFLNENITAKITN